MEFTLGTVTLIALTMTVALGVVTCDSCAKRRDARQPG